MQEWGINVPPPPPKKTVTFTDKDKIILIPERIYHTYQPLVKVCPVVLVDGPPVL